MTALWRDAFSRHWRGPGGIEQMVRIALPMVVSSACETAMTFTDRLFLSRLGPVQMAAAMGGGLTCFTMTTFFLGLTGYTTALSAQYYGRQDYPRCAISAAQAFWIALFGYPIILAAKPVAHMLFDLLAIPEIQKTYQIAYFDILLYGTLLSLCRNVLSSFFSGIGKTAVVMVASATSMAVNIMVNYILIFGKLGFPALGIYGAAIGTLIGSGCGLAVLAASYFAPANRARFAVLNSFQWDGVVMKKLLRFGYPAGLEFFLNLLAFNIVVLMFHAQGPATSAAITIVFNWDMVSFVPLIGINVGVTSLVGRFMGASQPQTAHRATLSGLKLAWVYSGCTMVAFAFFAPWLVQIFHPSGNDPVFTEAFPQAVAMLRLAALYVTTDAMFLVFSGALRGAGDTFWAMTMSVSFHWSLVILLAIALYIFHFSAFWAWFVLCGVFMIFSIVFYLRYRSGKWKNIRVIEPA